MKGVKKGSLYDVIFQRSSKQFQSNISRPNNNRRFYTSSHLHFKEIKSNFLLNFSKFWNMYFFCDVIISKLGKKGPKVVYHVSRVIERSKSIFDGTLKWGEFVSVTNLSKYCNFTSLSQNWVKKGPNLYFIYQWR